jgi:hypothetical protein
VAEKNAEKKLKEKIEALEKKVVDAAFILQPNSEEQVIILRKRIEDAERAIAGALASLDYDVDGATFSGPAAVVWRANMSAFMKLNQYKMPEPVEEEAQ